MAWGLGLEDSLKINPVNWDSARTQLHNQIMNTGLSLSSVILITNQARAMEDRT